MILRSRLELFVGEAARQVRRPALFALAAAAFLIGSMAACSEPRLPRGVASRLGESGKFRPLVVFSGKDGSRPFGDLLMKDGVLFGATSEGGRAGCGTLFRLALPGAFNVVHHFDKGDGSGPFGRLCDGGGVIYGAAKYGGPHDGGGLFEIRSDGSGFRLLHGFESNAAGFSPTNGPILFDDRLMGTVFHGGEKDRYAGAVYSLGLNSGRCRLLAELGGAAGHHPAGAILLHGGWFYGLTSDYERKEPGAHGAIFRLRPDGSGFEVCHRFQAGLGHPYDCLAAGPDGWLYGTTHGTFSNPDENGSVFRWHPESRVFGTLLNFNMTGPREGSKPNGAMVFSADGRFFYGTTHGNNQRGGNRPGTLYAVDLERRCFHVLHVFDGGTNGATPMRTPVLSGNRIYGLAAHAGQPDEQYPAGHGMLYSYTLPELAGRPGLPLLGDSLVTRP